MKKLFAKLKHTFKTFFSWLWMECKDWHTLVLFGIVCAVLSSTIWGGYLLGFIFDWDWALGVATVTWGFWLLPGAPFFTLSVSITLALKKIYEKRREKKLAQTEQSDLSAQDSAEEKGEGGESDIPDTKE